jgi:hypothetical protein
MSKAHEPDQTWERLLSHPRGRLLFARPPSMFKRLMDYLLPLLWFTALAAAGAAIW